MFTEEVLDVLYEKGKLTGSVHSTKEIHRKGCRHRVFILYISRDEDDGVQILMQKRSKMKKSAPGMWDGSVTGHYKAGEGIEAVLRETQEELGIILDINSLVYLGTRIN